MGVLATNPYIKSVDEISPLVGWKGTTFDASEGYHRSYVRQWRVVTLAADVGPWHITKFVGSGLPVPYAPYVVSSGETDLNALAVKIEAERDSAAGDSWDQWIVTVNYSTKVPKGGPVGWTTVDQSPADAPWLERPHREWESEEVIVAAQRDMTGKPYFNSAKMPFKPAPTVKRSRPIFVLERNEYRVDQVLIDKYTNCLNLYPFMGRPSETVQLLGPRAIEEWKGGISYWRVIYRLRFAREENGVYESLQPQFLDAGTHRLQPNALVPFASMPVPIIRPNGGPIVDPVVLDGSGQPLKPLPGGAFDFSKSWLTFTEYPLRDIGGILTSGLGAP